MLIVSRILKSENILNFPILRLSRNHKKVEQNKNILKHLSLQKSRLKNILKHIKMAAIFIGRRRRRQNAIPMRRPPVFCDLSNTLESLDEEEVYERYRFSPDTIQFVEDEVSDILQSDTAMYRPIPPLIHVLPFLRFVATLATCWG